VVPDTVRALLGARIDSLDPDAKAVLLAASVIGSSFWIDALASMVDVENIEEALDVLESEALIVPHRGSRLPSQRKLAFRHELVREVAYGSISRGRAARHHALVSDWIEQRVGDRRAEFIDLIAHHRAVAADHRLLGWPRDAEAGEEVRLAAIYALPEAAAAALSRTAWEESLRFIARAEATFPSGRGRGRRWPRWRTNSVSRRTNERRRPGARDHTTQHSRSCSTHRSVAGRETPDRRNTGGLSTLPLSEAAAKVFG
jgi:hypothetical protein